MNLNIHIKNIGKIEDARIRFGQFTVFAGPNNTGKSFVSKFLYSIYAAMNVNSTKDFIDSIMLSPRRHILDLRRQIHYFHRQMPLFSPDEPSQRIELKSIDSKKFDAILENMAKIDDASESFTIDDIDKISLAMSIVMERAKEMLEIIDHISPDSPLLSEEPLIDLDLEEKEIKRSVSGIKYELEKLCSTMAIFENKDKNNSVDAMAFIAAGIEHKIRENLLMNFQIATPYDLQRIEGVDTVFEIKDFGEFRIKNGNIYFRINTSSIQELQRYSRTLYLESPVYWRLKSALEDVSMNRRIFSIEKRIPLTGVPGYFYDLSDALRFKYSGEMDFPSIYEKLIGKEVLGGIIALSENGDLLFNENGRSFPLSVTASGVANLGMIALLIERKVLDKNTILFIDEPETNLHPAWQVIMAEVLFELAKRGVHVVLATHSADILKWLEVHIKRNPDDEKLVALNKFPVNNEDADQQDFDYKIADIKEELTKPFADLYMKGL